MSTAPGNVSGLSDAGQQSCHHSSRMANITEDSGFLRNQTSYLEMLADLRTRLSHIHCFPEMASAGDALIEDLGYSTPVRAIATFSQCLDQNRKPSGGGLISSFHNSFLPCSFIDILVLFISTEVILQQNRKHNQCTSLCQILCLLDL